MAEQIITKNDQGIFFQKDAELEVANMLNGMSSLGYRNDEVTAILHDYLRGGESFKTTGEVRFPYDLITLYTIITSMARLSP
jgi:hypothetical protein